MSEQVEHTVWKFYDFSTTQILCENKIGSFGSLKLSEFRNFGNFQHFQIWNFHKNQNSEPLKWAKFQSLTA